MSDPPPSRRQRRYDLLVVLDYIGRYHEQHQRSPSQRQIQQQLQISSSSVAHNLLHRLADAGFLRITIFRRGLSADLEITDAGRARLAAWRAAQSGPNEAQTAPGREAPDGS